MWLWCWCRRFRALNHEVIFDLLLKQAVATSGSCWLGAGRVVDVNHIASDFPDQNKVATSRPVPLTHASNDEVSLIDFCFCHGVILAARVAVDIGTVHHVSRQAVACSSWLEITIVGTLVWCLEAMCEGPGALSLWRNILIGPCRQSHLHSRWTASRSAYGSRLALRRVAYIFPARVCLEIRNRLRVHMFFLSGAGLKVCSRLCYNNEKEIGGASMEIPRLRPEQFMFIREARNLTQEDLAAILGVSQKAISKWENGRSVQSARYFNIMKDTLLLFSDDFQNPPLLQGLQIQISKALNIRLCHILYVQNEIAPPDDIPTSFAIYSNSSISAS